MTATGNGKSSKIIEWPMHIIAFDLTLAASM